MTANRSVLRNGLFFDFSCMPALLELHYLPSVAYFTQLVKHSHIILEQHEHYTKRSYRNRCHIAGANGLLRLSVPLQKGKNSGVPIREIRIANQDDWQAQHWQSIQSAYGNAPFFEFYADELRPYFEEKYEFLWDWNWDLLQEVISLLQLEVNITLSSEFIKEVSNNEVIDLRNKIKPNRTFDLPRYPQVFREKHGFLSNLSILDLLFCQSTVAGMWLEDE